MEQAELSCVGVDTWQKFHICWICSVTVYRQNRRFVCRQSQILSTSVYQALQPTYTKNRRKASKGSAESKILNLEKRRMNGDWCWGLQKKFRESGLVHGPPFPPHMEMIHILILTNKVSFKKEVLHGLFMMKMFPYLTFHYLMSYITLLYHTLCHLTLPYLMSYLTLPYILPFLTLPYVTLSYILSYLNFTLPYLTFYLTLYWYLNWRLLFSRKNLEKEKEFWK